MKAHKSSALPVIRSGDDIFTTFNKINDMIRERAYYISHDRDNTGGDEISDWFNAESELLTTTDFSVDEKEDQIIVQGNLKGFSPDEVEIKANDGQLNIGGIHSEKSSAKKEGMKKETFKQICFYQHIQLPADLDTEHMDIQIKGEKLTAKIPKTKH